MVTRRWRSALVVALCLVLLQSATAAADHRAPFDGPQHDYGEMVDYPLVFPVVGDHTLWDTFYASRSGGDHHAQDIMAPKMTPIVAAAEGTIKYINYKRRAADVPSGNCCTMVITHDDGWETWYLHMNNDTPGTDDGQGWGIAPGLEPGGRVAAGQLIGWVGDSGNAEWTGSHLHFELYDPEGVMVNPYQALLDAADPGEPFVALSSGSQGFAVMQLQTMLTVVGFDPGLVDASFGSLTETAVEAFQADRGLTVTGVVDQDTWDALVVAYSGLVTEPTRLAGSDRYATATSIADHTHPDGADIVFLAVGTNYPDAIASGPVAAALGAPILLTTYGALPQATIDTLRQLEPSTVYILGGEAAIHADVASAVSGLLPTSSVERLAGPTRYETAVEMSQAAFGSPVGTVYVVTGGSFADALVAAPAAVAAGGPVLLVRSTSIPDAVIAELERLQPDRIVIVGGTAAVSSSVYASLGGYADEVIRLSGPDRYATSAIVSAFAFPDGADAAYIAIGSRFPDALAGGAATGLLNGPMLLVATDDIPLWIASELRRLDPTAMFVLGGPAAVSEAVGITIAGIPATTGPVFVPPPIGGDDPPIIVHDPSQDSEQWRPLVEFVFAKWDLDEEKCGVGDRSDDCIGSQVDNALIIMQCESFGDPNIVNSSSGTTGLFQHRPLYWPDRTARVRTHFPDFSLDATPYDPYDNVMVAALLVHESRDALLGLNSFGSPWTRGPEPWGHWDGSAPASWCHDPPLVNP